MLHASASRVTGSSRWSRSCASCLLTYDGQVKLIDFGVAKVLNREQETQAGVLKGRVVYMAPEQVGGGSVDRRADIFSTGVLLREIVTGERLWEGLGEIETLKKLISREIPAFPAGRAVAPELREICEKAMAPRAEDRFKTAHEMRVRLEQYVGRADPAGSLADLGVHLARELDGERKRLKDIVDRHLAAGTKGKLPTIAIPASGGSSPDLSSGSMPGSGSAPRSGAAPSSSPLARTPASGTVVSGELPEARASLGAASSGAASGKRRSVVLAGVVVASIAIVALVLLRRSGDHGAVPEQPRTAQPTLAAAPPTPPSSLSPADERGDTIELSVRVTPPTAQIYVDDALVEGNPFRARFPRNTAATHAIRAAAAGFAPKTELVKFDGNASVTMSLERQNAGAAPAMRADVRGPVPGVPPTAPSTQAPLTSKPASSDINPRGGKAPKRDIDPKNPYGVE